MSARILCLDIETSPLTAHVWGLRDQNIGLSQIRQHPRVIGVGAGWKGKPVGWRSEYHQSRPEMLEWTRDLMDEADVVVHYNGNTFDIPWLRGEFTKEGIAQPSPFKNVDLYRVARKAFRLPSYKLQYVSTFLGLEGKVQTGGHELWVRCLEGEGEEQRKAWVDMRRYCRQDVALLSPMFDKLREFFPASVNLAVFNDTDRRQCPSCESTNVHRRGYAYTTQRAYPRYRCMEDGCGRWFKDTKSAWGISTSGVTG